MLKLASHVSKSPSRGGMYDCVAIGGQYDTVETQWQATGFLSAFHCNGAIRRCGVHGSCFNSQTMQGSGERLRAQIQPFPLIFRRFYFAALFRPFAASFRRSSTEPALSVAGRRSASVAPLIIDSFPPLKVLQMARGKNPRRDGETDRVGPWKETSGHCNQTAL